DQGEEADGNRQPAQHDRPAGGLCGRDDRTLVRRSGLTLLAPASDQEERIVDRHAKPDQGDEKLDEEADVHQVSQSEDEDERRQDRRDRDQEGDDRDGRGVDERKDRERSDRTDDRRDQHARPAPAATPAGGLDLLEPGHGGGRAGGG